MPELEFVYDGTVLTVNIETDPSTAMRVLSAIRQALKPESGSQPQATRNAGLRRGGKTRVIRDFLRENPGSTWPEIRNGLKEVGLVPSDNSLLWQLVKVGEVLKEESEERETIYTLRDDQGD